MSWHQRWILFALWIRISDETTIRGWLMMFLSCILRSGRLPKARVKLPTFSRCCVWFLSKKRAPEYIIHPLHITRSYRDRSVSYNQPKEIIHPIIIIYHKHEWGRTVMPSQCWGGVGLLRRFQALFCYTRVWWWRQAGIASKENRKCKGADAEKWKQKMPLPEQVEF